MPTLCFVEVTQLRTKAVDGRLALFLKKVKNSTFRPLTPTCVERLIFSTKFRTVIEVVRAIILGLKTFLGPIHSFAATLGVVENLAENATIAVD